MPKKVNVKQVVEEIGLLKIKIAEFEHMLSEKKKIMSRYFDSSGKSSITSGSTTVYVQTKTTIDYDIPAMKKKLDKDLFDEIVKRQYKVSDIRGLKLFLKKHDIDISDIKEYIEVEQSVDKDRLSKLYETGEITLADLEGCYDAKVTKTVAQRIKP